MDTRQSDHLATVAKIDESVSILADKLLLRFRTLYPKTKYSKGLKTFSIESGTSYTTVQIKSDVPYGYLRPAKMWVTVEKGLKTLVMARKNVPAVLNGKNMDSIELSEEQFENVIRHSFEVMDDAIKRDALRVEAYRKNNLSENRAKELKPITKRTVHVSDGAKTLTTTIYMTSESKERQEQFLRDVDALMEKYK